MKSRLLIKRIFDVVVSSLLVLLLLPVLVFVAALIAIFLGRPVLFCQARPGKNGKIFTLYKFRTMRSDTTDKDGNPLTDAQRLTRFGKFLRASSLDELPELFNVLRGDMSLVGPRPLMTQYLPLYNSEQMRRHDVLPGITGWAQVNGRNAISWERKFELDGWYVDHHSLWLDIKILFMTVWRVVRRDGVSHEDHATMPQFQGTQVTTDDAPRMSERPIKTLSHSG